MKNRKLLVYYNDKLVGTLALSKNFDIYFQYDKDWIINGFSINPFSLPLTNEIYTSKKPYFDGLFGVFADSLPDSWGRLLLERYLKKNNILDLNVLDRLAIISSSAMGALEYKPEYTLNINSSNLTLDEIAKECMNILLNESNDNLDEIFKLGGSSGGARPKILTKIDNEDWIIKFNNHLDMKDVGLMEYEYSLCAKKCGINMPKTKLFESNSCKGYFGIKRFDRNNGKKIHMISAAAILEIDYRSPALDYNQLMKLTKILTNNTEDVIELFRRMCFNVFAHNRDDHAKNFSYIYDEEKKVYRLSPAYDLTYSTTYYGEHTTSINDNGKNPTVNDLLAVGKNAGISVEKCMEIINSIKDTVYKDLNKYLKA